MHLFAFCVIALSYISVCKAIETNSTSSSTAPVVDAGDTAWMLASTALVMFMTPGLAFFYGGLVRAKHSVNTLLMSLIALGLVTVLWIVFGYSFAFGPGTAGFGSFKFTGFRNVGIDPYPPYSSTIPHLLFAVYQMMFAIITPAIISGAVVERMSFRSYVIFLLVWSLIIYNPIAHWVWSAWDEIGPDGETIQKVGWIRGIGALDFAGGTVVHMSSGYSAFVACLFVGKRKDTNSVQVHNVPFVLLGAAMLKQVTATGAACGAIVGLVGITPAAGFVHPASSLAVGAVTVVVCYFTLEAKAKYPN